MRRINVNWRESLLIFKFSLKKYIKLKIIFRILRSDRVHNFQVAWMIGKQKKINSI